MNPLPRSHGRWRRRIPLALVALSVVAGVLVIWTLRAPRSASGPPPAASATSSTAVGISKPPIHGLLYLRGTPPAAHRSSLAGYVVEGPGDYGAVSWSQLQPVGASALAANNPIDQAVAEVRGWNASNPRHREVLKVRINAGIHSPPWAQTLVGPCVTVTDLVFKTTGCVPRFWTAAFGDAFYRFESELSAAYDAVPEIAEVVIARNMTIYNEPLLRQINDPATVAGLIRAGYTTTADEGNQRTDMAALAADWKHTRVGFAFNPYQTLQPIGSDGAFTQKLMSYGRQLLGTRLVLENDSLRSEFLAGAGLYAQMYAQMSRLGSPIGFQTAVLSKVGNLFQTLGGAKRLGANYVELPPNFESQLTIQQLAVVGKDLPAGG